MASSIVASSIIVTFEVEALDAITIQYQTSIKTAWLVLCDCLGTPSLVS
jgi:hypothetical protein